MNVIKHTILLLDSAKPIRQPSRRLKVKNDQEVKRQNMDLVQKGMVEPTDETWFSHLVVV